MPCRPDGDDGHCPCLSRLATSTLHPSSLFIQDTAAMYWPTANEWCQMRDNQVSHLTTLLSPFLTMEAGPCCWWQCGKQQSLFNRPQPLPNNNDNSHYHITPPPTRCIANNNNNPQLPTNQDELAPAKTDHKHPHERRPLPTNGNWLQQAEVRQARLLPTTHLSYMESRCHVAIRDVSANFRMSLVVVYFRTRW